MASARENIIHQPTREMLKRVAGGRDGRYPFLELLTTGVSGWYDNFQGDTLHGGYQSTASGTGSAAAAIDTGKVNGQIKLDAGTANAGRSDLSLGRHYRADLKPVFIARIQVDDITDYKIEMGFTDVISGTDAGALNDVSSPTGNNADDCAVWVLSTADNAFLQGVGFDSTVAATKDEAQITGISALAAATFKTLIVELDAYDSDGNDVDDVGLARYTLLDENEHHIYSSDWQTAAISPTVLLTPWLFVQNKAGAKTVMNVDYVWAFQRRTRTG